MRAVSRVHVWAFTALFVWLAGVAGSYLKVAVGSLRARRMLATSRRFEAGEGAGERGLDFRSPAPAELKRVRVLLSPACRVPFTAGLLRPFIMLPRSARLWPRQRVWAVLLHELRHVARRDLLTQTAARLICSLFWFVPLTWIAYSFLYAEQEKACDAGVVESGVAPRDYAAYILCSARRSPQFVPIAGLYSPAWRKRILEDRIRNLVEGGRAVKKRWLVFACSAFVACVLVVVGGCLGAQPHFTKNPVHTPEWNEELYGTWVNLDYPGNRDFSQKWTLHRYGVCERYFKEDNSAADRMRTFFFIEKWKDSEGNVWYTTNEMAAGHTAPVYTLYKISEGGSTLETIWSAQGYPQPSELDPANIKYRVMYRK